MPFNVSQKVEFIANAFEHTARIFHMNTFQHFDSCPLQNSKIEGGEEYFTISWLTPWQHRICCKMDRILLLLQPELR